MKAICQKILLFAMILGGGATTLSAETFTVEDLTDNSTIAIDRLYSARQDGFETGMAPLLTSNQITLAKVPVSNNNTGAYYHDRVRLNGLIITLNHATRNLDYTFMLLDDKDNVVTEGATHIGIKARYYAGYYSTSFDNGDEGNKGYSIVTGYWSDMSEAMGDDFYKGYNFRGCSTAFYKGKITRDSEGDIHIDFEEPCVVLPRNSSTYVNKYLQGFLVGDNTDYVIDHYHIDIITPNAYLNGKVATATNRTNTTGSFATPKAHDPYPCKVKFNGSTFEVLNLTKNGYSIIKPSESINATHSAWITGGFNKNRGQAWMDRGQHVELDPLMNGSYNFRGNLRPMKLYPIERSPRAIVPDDDVEGTYTESKDLAHRVIKNYWVTNGGQLRTYEKYVSMTFGDFAYVYNLDIVYDGEPIQNFWYSDAYVDNALDIYDGDITHELDHQFARFGCSPIGNAQNNSIKVVTTAKPLKNPQHVKRYELYLVPGYLSDATPAEFLHDNGHHHAFYLDGIDVAGGASAISPLSATVTADDGIKRTSYTQIQEDGSVLFDVLINEDDLPNNSYNKKGQYSVFVKTIYNNHLEPTFHNLISPSEDIITGVDDLVIEDNTVAEPEYFDIMGRKVANPVKGQFYIQRRGATTCKIIY